MEQINDKEEVRCGYTISTKLKKIWNVELELMDQFFSVCKKYDLHPIVYSGTMLGAVRHNGFIPWDDDLDIVLVRDEFNKMLEIGEKEFSDPFFFQTALSDRKFFLEYARLRNSNTTGMVTWNKSIDYNNGIYIDIYPLDGMPENKILLMKQHFEKLIVKQFLASYYDNENYVSRKPKWLVKCISLVANIRSYEWWYKKYTQIVSRYSKTANRVTLMTHEYEVLKKYWCNRADLDDIIYVDFENTKVPVPRNYETILTNLYGNYMNFPPISERGAWHEGQIIFDPDTPYKMYFKTNDSKEETH